MNTQTIPPPRSTFGANILQYEIYDSYAEDFERTEREREQKDKKVGRGSNAFLGIHTLSLYVLTAQHGLAPTGAVFRRETGKLESADKNASTDELNKKYLQSWQALERMINQNIFDDIAQDYRYYEDPSDEFREEEGTLLPLWKFSYDKTKKLSVTNICFNTYYYDLFAVCYGSRESQRSAEAASNLFPFQLTS